MFQYTLGLYRIDWPVERSHQSLQSQTVVFNRGKSVSKDTGSCERCKELVIPSVSDNGLHCYIIKAGPDWKTYMEKKNNCSTQGLYLWSFPFYFIVNSTVEQRLVVGRKFWIFEQLSPFQTIAPYRTVFLVLVIWWHFWNCPWRFTGLSPTFYSHRL